MTTEHEARPMAGAELARDIVGRSAQRADEFGKRTGTRPCLAAVLVGDDPASVTYVRMKRRRCQQAGIESRQVTLPATTTTDGLVGAVAALSSDPGVHGILVQHPVPPHVDERAGFEAIAPDKDVDGVTMHSFAAMALGYPGARRPASFGSWTPTE